MEKFNVRRAMALYESEDLGLRAVAEKFSTTHETLRNWFNKTDPEFMPRVRKQRLEAATASAHEEREQAPTYYCRICGDPIEGRSKIVCQDHKEMWNVLKFHLDPSLRAAHREAQANTILAKPENYSEAKKRWARSVIGSDPPPMKPAIMNPGSRVYEVYQEYLAKFGHRN